MSKEKRTQDPVRVYVIRTYLLFWAMILVLGGVASMVLQVPESSMRYVSLLCSWSPTIVLLLMMKRLRPQLGIRGFYREAFSPRIPAWMLLVIPFLVSGLFLLSLLLSSLFGQGTLTEQLTIVPSALIGTVVVVFLQGPAGEESGWRGYLRPELEARHGFVRGSLYLGLIWAFWHAPLWFISGNLGLETLVYIMANVVVLTSLTLIMGIFMKRSANLFVAVWIHFWFNLTLGFYRGGILFFAFFSLVYLGFALVLVMAHTHRFLYGQPGPQTITTRNRPG
jgi:uncharacterized protein